jgi:hypothetical protein
MAPDMPVDRFGEQVAGRYDEYEVDRRLAVRSIRLRYVWPSELDLAGRRLRERWGREPFTAKGERHVSVWART